MLRKLLALAGVTLFTLSIVIALLSETSTNKASPPDKAAPPASQRSRDTKPQKKTSACDLKGVEAQPKTVSEKEGLVLVITLSSGSSTNCQDTLSLDAPNFSVTSPTKAVSIPPDREGKSNTIKQPSNKTEQPEVISWRLAAKEAGKHQVVVETSTDSELVDVVVKGKINWSQWLSSMGTIFGPMLTIPYWLDRWRERKSRRRPGENT